jgi:hypothetical protein
MKIQKIFSAISFINVYRIVSIFGMALMLGIIIHSICLKHDAAKLFVIFITTLGLFATISLLFVANSFGNKTKK